MKSIKTTLLILFSVSSLAIAGETCCPTGLGPWGYVFGYGGAAFGPEVDSTTGGVTTTYDFEDSFIGGGGIGLYSDFLCGSRFELEGLYSSNDLELINGVAPGAGISGDISVAAVMLNLLKEFPLGQRVTGYAGGGLGYAGIDFTLVNAGVTTGSSDSAIAYQAIIGADYCLTPCIAIFTQYKLLGIGDLDYGQTENESYITHNVMAGLRVSF